jgi:hypothetical protein
MRKIIAFLFHRHVLVVEREQVEESIFGAKTSIYKVTKTCIECGRSIQYYE